MSRRLWCALLIGAALCMTQAARAEDAAEPVVATFQGGNITKADLEAVIAQKVALQRVKVAQPGGRERALSELIDYDLLAREAERRGYATHPAVTLAVRERMVQSLVEKQLAVDPASIDKADVEAVYKAQAARFHSPELRRVRHVLLANEAEAAALIAELRSKGRDATTAMGKAARERSLDEESKPQSGDLGFFTPQGERLGAEGKIAPEIVKAAFALRAPGDLAPKPVRTGTGYSAVLLVGEREAFDTSLREAEGELRKGLATKATESARRALTDSLQKQTAIETHPERVEAIELGQQVKHDIPQGFSAAPSDPREAPHHVEPDGY